MRLVGFFFFLRPAGEVFGEVRLHKKVLSATGGGKSAAVVEEAFTQAEVLAGQ